MKPIRLPFKSFEIELRPRDIVLFALFVCLMVGLTLFYCTHVPSEILSKRRIFLLCAFECLLAAVIFCLLQSRVFKIENTFLVALLTLGITNILAGQPLTDDSERIQFALSCGVSHVSFEGFGQISPPLSMLPFYLLPAFGLLVGNVVGLGIEGCYYIVAFIELVVFSLCAYYAFRITPFGKPVFMVLAFLPTTLSAATSFGIECTVYCASFLLIALCFKASSAEKQCVRDLVIIAALALLLAPCKIIYSLLVFLVLTIPNSSFPKKKYGTIYKSCLVLGCLLLLVLTGVGNRDFNYEPGLPFPEGAYTLSEVLTHPSMFARLIIDSFFDAVQNTTFYLFGFFPDMTLDTVEFSYARFLSYALALMLVLAFLSKQPNCKPSRGLKYASTAIAAIMTCGLILYASIALSTSYNDMMAAINPAYLIPIIPLLIPLLTNTSIAREQPTSRTILFCTFCICAFYFVDLYGYIGLMSVG